MYTILNAHLSTHKFKKKKLVEEKIYDVECCKKQSSKNK